MILVLGSNGYVGSAFVKEISSRRLDYICLSRREVDYANFDTLRWYLKDHRPSLVINAAGYTGKPNVDACENHKEETFAANVLLPLTISHACAADDIPWAHISSGCIYNGGGPFGEDDEPNFSFKHQPCSYYSGTKAMAEELVRDCGGCYLWRLRMPFDEFDGPRNYLSKLQRYPRVYTAMNSISHRGDFVKACLDLWHLRAPFGAYNITNTGAVSTREVVDMIRAAGLKQEFEFFKDDAEFYRTALAPRSNCVLSVEKLLAAGVKIRPVQEALRDAVKKWTVDTT